MAADDSWLAALVRLGLKEADFEESFARSSGPGGQNVNKVSTAVTLTHAPSGASVTVQDSRSQLMNRRLARERLIALIVTQRENAVQAQRAERERERRRKRPRPPSLKRKIREAKIHRSATKKRRGSSRDD